MHLCAKLGPDRPSSLGVHRCDTLTDELTKRFSGIDLAMCLHTCTKACTLKVIVKMMKMMCTSM